ncbi:hypothetical protein CRENBAI_018921 [Crenichthys baileyi]|uniref:Uncharacterized protein n=1 Tax=Crenichthys baileyi TaxID=28760 RepID=A0AAV9SQP9_9TELE
MAILNVTKADEGYYKCSISGAGESPESWLAVSKPLTAPNEDSPSVESKQSKNLILESTLRFGFVALLAAVIGLTHYKKLKDTEAETTDRTSPCLSEETV